MGRRDRGRARKSNRWPASWAAIRPPSRSTRTNIYLEAAFWWPNAIQGRARRYNFSTDAAHRFERGVDYATTVEHIERITALIVEICGTPRRRSARSTTRSSICRSASRSRCAPRARAESHRRADRPTRRSPTSSPGCGLPFTREPGMFAVTPPSYRFDIEIEEDLIEEVARVYGFENIPALPPVAPSAMLIEPENTRSLFADPPPAGRPRLPGSGELELRRSSLGSTISPATPIRSSC